MSAYLAGPSDLQSDAPSPRLLRRRELGLRRYSFASWCRPVQEYRLSTLKIVGTVPVVFTSRAAATALDIDRNEHDFLLCGSSKGSIDVVNLRFHRDRNEKPLISLKRQHGRMINSCQWLPSGIEMFATASQDGTVKTWDLEQKKAFDTFSIENPKQMHWNEVDQRNPLIAVADESSNVILIDLRKGSSDHNMRNKTTVTALRWLPTERVLCTGDNQGRLKYWDIRNTMKPLLRQEVSSPSQIAAIRFTSDGKHLVCVDSCKLNVYVLDALTMENIYTVSAAFSPVERIHPNTRNICLVEDGKFLRIAVPSTQERIAWITLDTEKVASVNPRVQFLSGHLNSVSACVYRQGHQQLLSASVGIVVNWSSEGERAKASLETESLLQQATLDNWSDED